MKVVETVTKNIIFHIDNMADWDKWLQSLVSDIYLHMKNDTKDYKPGIYQVAWTVNTLEQSEGEEHAAKEGKE